MSEQTTGSPFKSNPMGMADINSTSGPIMPEPWPSGNPPHAMPRPVAVLCAARKTAYRDIEGVDIFDEVRDSRNFQGGMPVIAHPPCRRWTTFGMNMLVAAKKRGDKMPTDSEIESERNIGLFCARKVQECGGVLEQPANSKLWQAAGLPMPGSAQSPDSFSLYVWQRWWGYPIKKGTWLYFRGISQSEIHIPFCLHPKGNDGKKFEIMHRCKIGGETTVPAFAQWLVSLARTARMEIQA